MKQIKVLIIEDEEMLADAFKIALETKGFQVTHAQNGQEGLDKLDVESFDVVLLDLLMPVMDGKEFLQKLGDHDFPIIVFSNLDAQPDVEFVQKFNIDRYILKAWASPNEVVRVVEEAVAAREEEATK